MTLFVHFEKEYARLLDNPAIEKTSRIYCGSVDILDKSQLAGDGFVNE